MFRTSVFLTCLMVLSSHCIAKNDFASRSANWLQSALPESTEFTFNRQKIKFDGCKHKEYEILVRQPWSEDFALEASIGYAKNRIKLGLHQQILTYKEFTFVPRYQASSHISVGAGFVYRTEPEFRSANDQFNLPASQAWLVNSRIGGWQQDHHIELELSARRWQATDNDGNWFERGSRESRLNLTYVGHF